MPEIPSLPHFSDLRIDGDKPETNLSPNRIPQLPTFPSSSLGDKFSQNSIKDAVSGKKEGDEELIANDVSEYQFEEGKMQELPKKTKTIEIEEDYKKSIMDTKTREKEIPKRKIKRIEIGEDYVPNETVERVNKNEPVFVRIDKFEETKNLFEKTRIKVEEIEKMLKEIRRVRNEEEKELQEWETEVYMIKSHIEKVERDIFSKIE